MPYDVYMLKLTKAQVAKLSKGKKVRLSHAVLSQPGDVKVFLTKQQAKRIQTRMSKGLGVDLGGFDMKQIAHNVKYGMGFWSSIKSFLGKAANVLNRSIVQPVMSGLQPIFEDAAERVTRRTVGKAGELIDTGLRRFGAGVKRQKGKKIGAAKKVTRPVGSAPKRAMPEGLRRYLEAKRAGKIPSKTIAKTKNVKDGEGFFSDVFRPVAGVAAEEGLKYAAPAIGKAISGKGLMGNFGLFGNGYEQFGGSSKKRMMGSSFRTNFRQ